MRFPQSWRHVACEAARQRQGCASRLHVATGSVCDAYVSCMSYRLCRSAHSSARLDARVESTYPSTYNHASAAGPSYSQYVPLVHRLNNVDEPHHSDVRTLGVRSHSWTMSRVEAYRQLRQQAPFMLSDVTDEGLYALCDEVATAGMSIVLQQLLIDLGVHPEDGEGELYVESRESAFLNASKSNKRRCLALQSLLNAIVLGRSRSNEEPKRERQRVIRPLSANRATPFWLSTQTIKEMCLALADDIDALAAQTKSSSEIVTLDHLLPEVSRWLLVTLARSGDSTLIPFTWLLWKELDVQDLTTDFPTLEEADGLIGFYLAQSRTSTSSDVDCTRMALQIFDTFRNAHPAAVSAPNELLVDTVADRLDKLMGGMSGHVDGWEEEKERLCLLSAMSLIAAQEGDAKMTRRSLSVLENRLTALSEAHEVDVPLGIFTTLACTAFQALLEVKADDPNTDLVFHSILPFAVREIVEEYLSTREATPNSASTSSVLREYIKILLRSGHHDRAVSTLFATEQEFLRHGMHRKFIAPSLLHNTDALTLIEHLAGKHESTLLFRLLQSLGVFEDGGSVSEDAFDHADVYFTTAQRGQVVLACARCRLKMLAIALYDRWAPKQAAVCSFEEAYVHLRQLLQPVKRIRRSDAINRMASSDDEASLTQSSACLSAMVRLLVDDKSRKKPFANRKKPLPREVSMAYRAIFTFLQAKSPQLWDAGDLLNLCQVFFHMGLHREAFSILAEVRGRGLSYSPEMLGSFVEAMALMQLEAATELLESWSHDLRDRGLGAGEVYAPLVTQCLLKGRFDLVKRVIELAHESGVVNDVAIRSVAALLIATSKDGSAFLKQVAQTSTDEHVVSTVPSAQAQERQALQHWLWIERLVKNDDWTPEHDVMQWMVNNAVLLSNQHNDSAPNGTLSIAYSTIASRILCFSASRLGQVDHTVAMAVVKTFHSGIRDVRSAGSLLRRRIIELDKVVASMRWAARYRDDENESRQVHALLQASNGLSSADTTVLPAKVSCKDDTSTLCNRLPVKAFRALMLAYIRLGDFVGAASIMEWARDECKLTLEEVGRGLDAPRNTQSASFANLIKNTLYSARREGSADERREARQQVFLWLSGHEQVPRTKSWWIPSV